MGQVKLSVSLSPSEVAVLDKYAQSAGLKSRSAAICTSAVVITATPLPFRKGKRPFPPHQEDFLRCAPKAPDAGNPRPIRPPGSADLNKKDIFSQDNRQNIRCSPYPILSGRLQVLRHRKRPPKTRYLSRSDDRDAMSAFRLRIGGFPLTHPIAGRTRRGHRRGEAQRLERSPEWYGYLSAWNSG